jgi:ABC-type amino acid transport substrate-binding protein
MGTEHNAENMANPSENSPSTSPAPPIKKKGIKPLWIAVIAILIVVALVAVAYWGGFLSNDNEDDNDAPQNLLEEIQANGKIVVGTQVPYPPFENYDVNTGKYEGIDIEIMERVAQELGVELEWKPMDFDPLFGSVQTGQIDCAISSITITSEREKTVNFTNPYYVANQGVLIRDSSSISNIDDLNGTKVVVQAATTGQYWADENLVDAGRVSSSDYAQFTDVPAAALTIENGQNDAFIVDTPVAFKYANDTNFNLKVGFIIETNENYGIMIPQNEPELKAAINQILAEMIADGTLDQIINKWM